MNSEDVHKRINEFRNIRKNAGADEASLLEVALFVEDVFGIILSDSDICKENFGTHEETQAFVLKKLNL